MDSYENKTILITGAGGSLGSELVKRLLGLRPKKIKALGHSERSLSSLLYSVSNNPLVELVLMDICDYEGLKKVIDDVDYVIHCAAVKTIDLAHYNAPHALRTNIDGTMNIIRVAMDSLSVRKVMFISTDKVVYPITLYGATKLVGEFLMDWGQKHSPDKVFCCARNGNFYRSNMSAIEIWERQKKEGKPLTITHPGMKRYFIEIGDVAKFVLDRLLEAKGGEVFIPGPDILKEMRIIDIANGISTEHVITGLRPYEKMNELLWMEEEEKYLERNGFFTVRKP